VFAQPSNAFVMDFLGSVNVFQGRAQGGLVHLGAFSVPYPDYPHDEPSPATAYIRPHEVDIDRAPHGESSLPARVTRINRSGPVVKISLVELQHDKTVEVELDHQRDHELNLAIEDTVYVFPRHVRVFLPGGPVLTSLGV
jgi:sulfate transport system ATP-binding protein